MRWTALVKIGARAERHGGSGITKLAEVAVP